MEVKIEIENKDARRKLHNLISALENKSAVTAIIAKHLHAITRRAFRKEQDPITGKPWAELSPVTLAIRKKRRKASTKKLRQTRLLLDSIVADSDDRSAIVGTNLVYATTHQFGAKRGEFGSNRKGAPIPWGDIPARPFLGINKSDADAITTAVTRYIQKNLT